MTNINTLRKALIEAFEKADETRQAYYEAISAANKAWIIYMEARQSKPQNRRTK